LTNARDYFFQLVNDMQQTKPVKKSGSSLPTVVKTSLSDYDEQIQFHYHYPGLLQKKNFYLYTADLIPDNLNSTPEQPPEIFISSSLI
jgi:hypothetical protein